MRLMLTLLCSLPLVLVAQDTPLNFIGEITWDRNEVSGIVKFPEMARFLMIEDSGNEPTLSVVMWGGVVTSAYVLPNLRNRDWEDLQIDQEGFLYIGDIGNNFSNRDTMVIYRLENVPGHIEGNQILYTDSIQFTYSDQWSGMPYNPQGNFDCEAFVVDGDFIHLYSKDHSGRNYTKHYVMPNEMGVQTAQLVDSTQLTNRVTGAHFRNGCPQLYLCSDAGLTTFTDVSLREVYDEYTFDTVQIEAVCKDNSGRVFLVEESENEEGGSKFYYFTERKLEEPVQLFPNPTSALLTMRFTVPARSIGIYQSNGTLVFEEEFEMYCTSHVIDVSTLHEGQYILVVETENDPVVESFLKLD